MNKFEQNWLLLLKNGIFSISLDHFLAMFPASILVPVFINNHFNMELIDISTVLIANAIGTVIFIIITKGSLPVYLGSSFAYISVTIYLLTNFLDKNISLHAAYSYVLWAYIFSALIIATLSFIYKYEISKKIMKFLFPNAIIGSVISLIGLELSVVGANDAGFNDVSGIVDMKTSSVALITLTIILLSSVIRRNFFKNSSIVMGVLLGYFMSIYLFKTDLSPIWKVAALKIPIITFPSLSFPPDSLKLFLSVFPASIVIFMENISRITVVDRLKQYESGDGTYTEEIFSSKNNMQFLGSLRGHSISILISALLGSVPTTIYAENIAIMSINKNDSNMKHKSFNPFSCIPYIIAAFFSIAVSFIGGLQYLLMNIPKPVIGGVELFLFGIITAPGIQMLVEQRVNYKKISNQILTASVLVAGVGGFAINLESIQIKGMSLGLAIGVSLNILFRVLEFFGILNEYLSFDEVVSLCKENCKQALDPIVSNDKVEIPNYDKKIFLVIEKSKTNTYLSIKMSQIEINNWCSIYDDVVDRYTDELNDDWLKITITSKIPNRHLIKMINSSLMCNS